MNFALALFVILTSLLFSAAFAQNKPKIVYILVDNWGWGDTRTIW
jgi:Skp family chaperone for outer membrane proteins